MQNTLDICRVIHNERKRYNSVMERHQFTSTALFVSGLLRKHTFHLHKVQFMPRWFTVFMTDVSAVVQNTFEIYKAICHKHQKLLQ